MWEDIWTSILAITTCAFISLGIFSLCQDHTIVKYYLGAANNSTNGFVVKAQVNWSMDQDVFVTDDINRAIEKINQLNQTLVKEGE